MDALAVVNNGGDHSMSHANVQIQNGRSCNISIRSTSDAVTLPTRRQMNSVKNQFEAWYSSLNPVKQVIQLSKLELADVVKNFYMTTRKKDGNPYKLCSYLAIRRCLSLIFQYDYGLMHVDISCDPEFLDANVVFSQMSHSLRGREDNHGMTELWRLTPEKLMKLYTEGQLDFYNTQNPKVLLQTVYFYVCYYTGIGKLSVMRQIVTNDIEEVIENGRLVAYNFNLRKYLPNEKGIGPFTIYEIQGKPWCPVLTIREYLSHRNKSVQSFFQKPLTRAQCFSSAVWFRRSRFKDIYPLANMSHEAHIDPPITSGCFTKSRISAEIRYDMSFVYATLFPQCFKSVGGIQQGITPSVMKKRRPKRPLSNGIGISCETFPQVSMQSNSSDTVYGEGKTAAQSVSRSGSITAGGNTSPQSMPMQSFSINGQCRQPVNQAIRQEPLGNAATTTASNNSHVSPRNHAAQNTETPGSENILQQSEIPSISVTNVYSFKRDALGNGKKHHEPPPRYPLEAQQSAQLGHLDNDQSKETAVCNDTEKRAGMPQLPKNSASVNRDDSDVTEDYHDSVCRNSSSFKRDVNYGSRGRCPSNAESESSSYSAANSSSPGYQQTHSTSKSSTVFFEPQSKRSRFDASSHTFLREISASAREQGKGAVMLLLSLLDELSNNKGKDLLKDILQEMRVI